MSVKHSEPYQKVNLGIALAGLLVTGIACIAAVMVVPEFRQSIGLEPPEPGEIAFETPAETATTTPARANPTVVEDALASPPSPTSVVFADYFDTDTLDSYQRRGIMNWDPASRSIISEGVLGGDSIMYTPVTLHRSFIASGRVYIPDSGIGRCDSIALALRGNQTEYWGILAYGIGLAERNYIVISRNDRGGSMYPLALTSGWYTIRMQVDQSAMLIRMKAWTDDTNEPGWQVTGTLDPGWTLSSVGFRHAGDGISRMDDLIVTESP
jgi:hypothetical protein